MSAKDYDSRTADKFVVRLPDNLRSKIEAAANASDRSMNSVFIQAVRQYLDGQNHQQILLDALASTVTTPFQGGVLGRNPSTAITDTLVVSGSMHIDDRVRMMSDPRDLFINANPIGANKDELEKGRNGFVDIRTHADYLVFLAGYRAAIETPAGSGVTS